MPSSLPTTTSSSDSAFLAAKTTANLPFSNNCSLSRVSFLRLSPNPKLRLFTKDLRPGRYCSTPLKAQLNEEAKDVKPENEASPSTLATEESMSEFISQVSSLIKLVDSRDIVELHLKQLDCELIIRKKEALLPPPSPAPITMAYPPSTPAVIPPAPLATSAAIASPPPSASPPSSSPPAAKSSKSSLPALKCPMAGTFYRSPAPSEPPFVKVGDKVQKGQVLCIIEAMKLMNEIEADQSGTIVDILVEDGKSVSVDMPLFVIEP